MLGNGLHKQGDSVSKAYLGFIAVYGLWEVKCFEDTGHRRREPGLAIIS